MKTKKQPKNKTVKIKTSVEKDRSGIILEDINSKIDLILEGYSVMNDKLDSHDEKLDSHTEMLGSLLEWRSVVNNKLDSHDKKLDSHTEMIASLKEDTEILKANMAIVVDDTSKLKIDMKGLEEKNEALAQRIVPLEKKLSLIAK